MKYEFFSAWVLEFQRVSLKLHKTSFPHIERYDFPSCDDVKVCLHIMCGEYSMWAFKYIRMIDVTWDCTLLYNPLAAGNAQVCTQNCSY